MRRIATRSLRKIVFTIVCLLLLAINGFAQLGADKETLRGITGIDVFVNPFDSAQVDEIKTLISQIQKDTEIRLRRAGIRVLNGTKNERDSHTAILSIEPQIHPLKALDGFYIYSTDVEIQQDIRLIRNPNITRRFVATYEVPGEIGITSKDNLSKMRDKVADLVDTFINDYLTINPK